MPDKPPDPPPPSSAVRMISTVHNQWAQFVDQPQPFIQTMPSFVTTLTPMYLQILAQSCSLAGQGQQYQCQFAVVLALTACELATEQALVALLKVRGTDSLLSEAMLSIVAGRRSKTLGNRGVMKVFEALTRERGPTNAAWWQKWQDFRTLRDYIAHRGDAVTQTQASECAETASLYIDYLRDTVERVGRQPPPRAAP
jgi:hypothetical protein